MLSFSKYKTLFKVSIHHSYFLNYGENEFVDLGEKERQEQLKNYDWRNYLEIQPAKETQDIISGQKLIFKAYPTGFSIGVKIDGEDDKLPFVSLGPALRLTFFIRFTDSHFFNYTGIDTPKGSLLYLSNRTPRFPESHNVDFIPLEQPPQGLSGDFWINGANKDHVLKAARISTGTVLDGLLQIYMQGDTGQYNLITNQGKLKNNPLHFRLSFPNKSTFWKYISRSEGFETETKKAWPLTKNGFIQLDPQKDLKSPPADAENYSFPNPVPGLNKIKSNKTYSEIFI